MNARCCPSIVLLIAGAPLHAHETSLNETIRRKCGDVSTLTGHLHLQDGFLCLPVPILKELLSRQSMVSWSWLG